jgi:hypothetical protein
MMAQAGYNPLEMARFFEKLAAQGGGRAPTFLSSHPDPGDRMQLVQEEIRTLPQRNYSTGNDAALQQIQARLGSLPASTGTRARTAGAVGTGDPRPSGRFKQFRGQVFAMDYPDNWEVFGDQNGVSVTIAPRSGLVQDSSGNVSVGYGVMVSGFTPMRDTANLRQDTSDLIAQLRRSNPAMQVAGNQRSIRLNGQPALVTTLYNQSPLGGQEVDMLVTVERPEGLLYMVFIAPQNDFRNVQSVFEHMLSSIRF